MNPGFKRAVWLLNTIGLVIYLVWLYSMGDRQILREQDGIVYFLPCIPFFFVYMLLINPKPRPTDRSEDDQQDSDSESSSSGPRRR